MPEKVLVPRQERFPLIRSAGSNTSNWYNDHGESRLRVTKWVYIYSLCAALNSCNLGFDIGINTSAAKLLQNSMDLSDSQIEIFMGSLNLFGMVGALSSQFITDYLGRKKAFQVAALIFIVGVIPTAFAQNFTTLIFGRVFVGLGIGFGLAIDPLYISEISPAGHRGHFVTYSELATNVGILIGFSCGLIFSRLEEDLAWRVMLLMGIVLPIIVIFLALFIMPESPRWLVQNNRMQEARVVLDKLYPPHFDTEELVEDIKQSIDRDLLAEHAVGWQIILHPTPAFKRILVVGIGMALAHQIVGVDAIQYYLIFIIEDSGLHSRTIQGVILVILGFLKMAFIILAGHFFDIKGRKPLIFASLTGMTATLLILSINFALKQPSSFTTVLGLAIYVSFFSLGMGPAAWLIPSEVFPTPIRGKATSLATFLNRVACAIMTSTVLSLVNIVSWTGYFLLLAAVCPAVALFFFFFLPETKGKTLEDMALYFAEVTGDEPLFDIHASQRLVITSQREVRNSQRALMFNKLKYGTITSTPSINEDN